MADPMLLYLLDLRWQQSIRIDLTIFLIIILNALHIMTGFPEGNLLQVIRCSVPCSGNQPLADIARPGIVGRRRQQQQQQQVNTATRLLSSLSCAPPRALSRANAYCSAFAASFALLSIAIAQKQFINQLQSHSTPVQFPVKSEPAAAAAQA